ncbi:hypothetical protein [Mucilaginibacter sp.]|uniref:hypothetical protein n=1 Tax=Mucilaginibacter sp. TaxID=1882438 RepID=UPI0032636A77
MIKIHIVALLLISSIATFTQDENIDYREVRQDSIFIANTISILKKDPANITMVTAQNNRQEKQNLGYGYTLSSVGTGRGNAIFDYTLITYKGKLVGYQLIPRLPYDQRLANKYRGFYSRFFYIRGTDQIEPYQFNYASVAKPVNAFKTTTADKYFRYLMTPYSGTIYGGRGGYNGRLLTNRELFEKVKKNINPAAFEELLYSINPATRLLGIEYYHQKGRFILPNKASIEKRIDEIFKEMQSINTMDGCLLRTQNSRDLVAYYAANPVH